MNEWIKFLRPYGVSVVCGLLMAMTFPQIDDLAMASPIKNWTSNEYIRYSDLNNVVNHLHANLGHGHGAIITANDIASNAGIRPEQTTFGTAVNRALVHEGTYSRNPDGGSAYVPFNYSGSLVVTITSTLTGFTLTGSAESGAGPDGGAAIYTVMHSAMGDGGATDCWTLNSSLTSPLSLTAYCDYTVGAAAGGFPPFGVAVQVYSNKVQ